MSVKLGMAVQMQAAGLPVPQPEYRFAPPRRWRFDWALFSLNYQPGASVCVSCNIAFKEVMMQAVSFDHRQGKGWSAGRQFVERSPCQQCGQLFYAPPSQRKRGGGKFCSKSCRGRWDSEHREGLHFISCGQCGKSVRVAPCLLGRKKYCSKACAAAVAAATAARASSPCPGCGSVAARKTKYCTAACYHLNNTGPKNRNWKGGRPIMKCLACGKDYPMPRGSHGLVCSIECWRAIQVQHIKPSDHPRGKGGKREDLGGLYVRSRWEANWARYLNWLVAAKKISRWEYEPDTFEFHRVKKGNRYYTPDFKVFGLDGSVEYHEVKGWLDSDSKTKLKRMALYHPDVKIVLVDKPAYRAVAKQVAGIIPHWETDKKKGLG